MLDMIDAGAEDIELEEGIFTITGEMESFGDIQRKLEELGVTPEEASLERIQPRPKPCLMRSWRKTSSSSTPLMEMKTSFRCTIIWSSQKRFKHFFLGTNHPKNEPQ